MPIKAEKAAHRVPQKVPLRLPKNAAIPHGVPYLQRFWGTYWFGLVCYTGLCQESQLLHKLLNIRYFHSARSPDSLHTLGNQLSTAWHIFATWSTCSWTMNMCARPAFATLSFSCLFRSPGSLLPAFQSVERIPHLDNFLKPPFAPTHFHSQLLRRVQVQKIKRIKCRWVVAVGVAMMLDMRRGCQKPWRLLSFET